MKYILDRNLIPAEGALRLLIILVIEQGNDFDISLRIVGKKFPSTEGLEQAFGAWVEEESEQAMIENPYHEDTWIEVADD